jgi:alpha-L-fucosidase
VGPYRDTWESLKAHQYPTWFLDAKFGIYTHWGPVTVATEDAPSAMEWYGQQLYQEKHPAFACHRQKYGEQIAFGYKDIIPRFTRGFRVVDTGVSRDHREYAIPAQ